MRLNSGSRSVLEAARREFCTYSEKCLPGRGRREGVLQRLGAEHGGKLGQLGVVLPLVGLACSLRLPGPRLNWYRYGEVKNIIAHYRHSGPGSQLASSDYFLASGAAGVLTAILTNPIWVIKTRMLTSSASSKGAYTGIRHGTKHIWQTEGFFGFYRGLAPSLIGVSHGAIQFMCYEQFKNWRTSAKEADPGRNRAGLSNFDYLTLSAASKMFAGTITYPYQVLRTRLQTYDAVGTVRSVVRDVWTQEGMRGFYKGYGLVAPPPPPTQQQTLAPDPQTPGSLSLTNSPVRRLGPNLLRVVPSTCVTFLTYENVKVYFPRLYHNESLFDD